MKQNMTGVAWRTDDEKRLAGSDQASDSGLLSDACLLSLFLSELLTVA
jgi:hypothetical protein